MRRILVLAGVLALAWAVLHAASWGIVSLAIPPRVNPGVLDVVFDNRAVVAAVRVSLLAAAAFVVWSVACLAADGRYITDVGAIKITPHETKQEIEHIEREYQSAYEKLDGNAFELFQENEELREQIRIAYELISLFQDAGINIEAEQPYEGDGE